MAGAAVDEAAASIWPACASGVKCLQFAVECFRRVHIPGNIDELGTFVPAEIQLETVSIVVDIAGSQDQPLN